MITFFRSPFWILRVGLFGTFFWFGIYEIWKPHLWIGWVPSFFVHLVSIFDDKSFLKLVIIFHGIGALVVSLAILSDKFVRLAAFLMILLILPVFSFGINEITVRDFTIVSALLTLIFFHRKSL